MAPVLTCVRVSQVFAVTVEPCARHINSVIFFFNLKVLDFETIFSRLCLEYCVHVHGMRRHKATLLYLYSICIAPNCDLSISHWRMVSPLAIRMPEAQRI